MIGIFDSGVGGLSVLRHVRRLLPAEDVVYVADQAHVPYGPRPASEIHAFADGITRFLRGEGVRLVVVACNTATAAALDGLRADFPDLPFVGMEPAVKPGAAETRSGLVGVLATAGTFESQRYATLMARFARGVTLLESPCEGLVPLIEAGRLAAPETEQLLRRCLEPMLSTGVDTVVLGCTHYPFVLLLIRRIVGAKVKIIDPSPAVARQALRVLPHRQRAVARGAPPTGALIAYTTGDPAALAALGERLLGYPLPTQRLIWRDGTLFRV